MTKLNYTAKIGSKVFSGKNVKDAYMKAVKWCASNVISNEHAKGVQVEYKKNEEKKQVIIDMYVSLPEDEIAKQHCECCKEMHQSFFINEANNCNECKIGGYKRRMQRKIDIKGQYVKEQIKKKEGA